MQMVELECTPILAVLNNCFDDANTNAKAKLNDSCLYAMNLACLDDPEKLPLHDVDNVLHVMNMACLNY